MKWACTLAVITFALAGCRSKNPASGGQASDRGLAPASSFASIKDPDARARALFTEAARVLTHPRCSNCHPPDKRPRQGELSILHDPPVWGGPDGRGVPALRCTSCHQDRNYDELAMPGAPDWHLAPPEMVFLGRSAGQICEQLKDNQRNGGKTIPEVVEHITRDNLVAWGFEPGLDRKAPPGTQKTLAGLIAAWADDGAACPEENQ